MTFRLPFQISRVGALCRSSINLSDRLVGKLVTQTGDIKKLILCHINQIRFASIFQECKHAASYGPTKHSSTLSGREDSITPKPKLEAVKECESNEYYPRCEVNNNYPKLEKTNIEPCVNRMPTKARPKISFSNRCIQQLNAILSKYDNYEMEINDIQIKDIDGQKKSTTKREISTPRQEEAKHILSDIELKVQNDIWLEGISEIANSLNSKNNIWKLICGKRKTMKHDFINLTTPQTAAASTKTGMKDSRPVVHLGTRRFPYIFRSTKRQPGKAHFGTASKLQPRFCNNIKKFKSRMERMPDVAKRTIKNSTKYLKENTQTPVCDDTNEISDTSETKESLTNSNDKIHHTHMNLNSSKRPQSKSSKLRVQPNMIMSTVYNRRLNNPIPSIVETHKNTYRCYHRNDLKSCNTFKYSKTPYNGENNTDLLHKELAATNVTNIPVKNSLVFKSASTDKIIKSTAQKEEPSLETRNKKVAKQRSLTPTNLNKKKDAKIGKKIKSTRIPRTLGEIYGVGKIPFLVEVSKSGQAKHKQYLVVMQLPSASKYQDSSLNSTNSPMSLIFDNDIDSDFLQELQEETLLSPRASLNNCFKANKIAGETITKKHVPEVDSIGLVKNKNKILPLLEIIEKSVGPLFLTKLSQQQSIPNKKDKDWAQKTPSQLNESKGSNNADDQRNNNYKEKRNELRRIVNSTEYMKNLKNLKGPPVLSNNNQVRMYSTMNRRNQTTKRPVTIPNKRCTVAQQQKCNLSCCWGVCSYCGQCPCVCNGQCSPCGWYPYSPCRPQCCPKFQLDYCCPRFRWDCSIPVPPCCKIEAPYPSFGENMPTWCKEITECFDYAQHMLQPKNQVSPKINLMEESIPKVTVVDPALQRKCCIDKWCEPCYPCVDQRICFSCPYNIPVDHCCPRGRPHCYCWPDKPCWKNPPPYRCFSDEDLEFPEVEITEHDLAKRFASDLYRRMGKKCKIPFTPACMVQCDLRSGEPRPVCKYDPRDCCSTTCVPPGAYLAPYTCERVPPCQNPDCNTCNNCCMPAEGPKKTVCSKCCPPDCCGCCTKQPEDN